MNQLRPMVHCKCRREKIKINSVLILALGQLKFPFYFKLLFLICMFSISSTSGYGASPSMTYSTSGCNKKHIHF